MQQVHPEQHPIPPTWDRDSHILILGSFPSVKSRETGYFYGHPQNRFWQVMAAVFKEPIPETIPEKRAFLLRNHIAAWDVIASCEIAGSSDSSIRNALPNDLLPILQGAAIGHIYTNGKTADRYYRQYQLSRTGREAICLPSTSPANAAWSLQRLIKAWERVREDTPSSVAAEEILAKPGKS